MRRCTGRKWAWIVVLLAIIVIIPSWGWGSGSVGQIDASLPIERVAISSTGTLYAWDQEGQVVAGWPKDLAPERTFRYVPRLVDVDLDQELEIVAVSSAVGGGTLVMHVFKGDGTELSTWHFPLPHDALVATPLIADVDHDSSLDIAYATPQPAVHVYRRDFSPAPNFAKEVAATPYLVTGDPDNNGLTDLFAAVGSTILTWDEVGNMSELFALPAGEEIIGGMTIVDLDRDFYPDLVLTTTAHRIVGIDQHGLVILALTMPDGVELIAPLMVEDVDVDHLPELIVLTAQHEILAFEPNGASVAGWSVRAGFRQPAPVGGVVANDVYRGLFASATGWDQRDVYRTNANRYGEITLGDTVREWDTFAHFDFLEPIEVFDLFTFPKPFTPNGDGVNDTTVVHYRLSAPALVAIDLYDAHERFLARIYEKAARGAGEHNALWNGINTQGTVTLKDDVPLDTGLYLLKVVAESPEGFVSQATVSAIVNGVKAEIETPTDDDETDTIYPKVFGITTLMGIATDPNFGENQLDADFRSYKLYYRPGVWGMTPDEIVAVGQAGSPWLPLEVPIRHQCVNPEALEPADAAPPHSNVSCRPVQHGILGTFDASDPATTPNGEYTLLLKVTDSNGNTVGKVNYDTVVVTVANPSPNAPYDPDDLFDKDNPKNPIYQGPTLSNLSLTNPLITKPQPLTTITYTLGQETADLHITIYAENQGAGSPVAAFYSWNAVAPNHPGNPQYQFIWNGTNTLGKPVKGGSYRIQIAAYAVDGTGVAVDDSLTLSVAKGFAASDILNVAADSTTGAALFTATPAHFNPLGFGADLAPEKTFLDYALTKEAKVTIQVLEAVSGQGLIVHKTLINGQVQQFDDGNTFWDGSGENGLILPVDRDYIIRLTAESIDIGNPETIQAEVVVHLDAASLSGSVAADLESLHGDDDEAIASDDQPITALVGNPDFLWRANGSGYVEMPFQFDIEANAKNKYYVKVQQTYASPAAPLKVCHFYLFWCDGGPFGSDSDYCPPQVFPLDTAVSVGIPTDMTVVPPVKAVSDNPLHGVTMSGVSLGNPVTATVSAAGPWEHEAPDTPNLVGCSERILGKDHITEDDWICHPDKFGVGDTMGDLWTCGNGHLEVLAEKTTSDNVCDSPTQAMGWTNGTVLSGQGAVQAGAFAGGGIATCDQKDVVPGSTFDVQYRLRLTSTINGQTDPSAFFNGQGNGGYLVIDGVKGWLGSAGGPSLGPNGTYNSGTVYAMTNPSFDDGYHTNQHDPYLATAPYKKIWALYPDFNEEFYRRETDAITIYADGYQPNIFNGSPGSTLYSFSDRVHLTAWDIEVRYPNITTSKADGDNALDSGDGHLEVFHLESTNVTPAGTRGTQNSNIEDTFRLRLKPEAVPRRFVEIHGTATANYELYYYDNDATTPQWHAIPPRTANPVTQGLLAHWDVTALNGEHYTVVLKGTQGDQVNLDTMDIAIGTLVDTSSLGPNEFVRVYSTFKKASLIFGAGALPDGPALITITPVTPEAADFALPSGIAPLGPIFDITPDDLVIDPAYHVQLELVFTPAELQEAFGVEDPSELTIYNLTGPQAIEGLATIITLNDMDDDDPTNDVWQFTASLEHFSHYFLAKKVAGFIHLGSPSSDAYLHGIVDIVGRVETAPRAIDASDTPQPLASLTALTVSAYPEDQPNAAVLIGSGGAEFAMPWDVSALNGHYRLRIEAAGPAGATAAREIPVAIDNTPTLTTLRINGAAIADGANVTVAPGAMVELVTTDHQSTTWQSGIQGIEYGLDDAAAFVPYEQPFNLMFGDGTHTITYRGIDQNGNVEPPRSATVVIAEEMAAEQGTAAAVQLTIDGPHVVTAEQTWAGPATTFALALAKESPGEQIRYRLGGADFLPYTASIQLHAVAEGPYIFEYFAVDPMGLRGPVQSRTLLLDRSAPLTTLTADGLALSQGTELVIAPTTTIALTAQDQGELPVGVDRIEYRLGEAAWQIYTQPLALTGTTLLSVRALDRVDNIEPVQTRTVRIDDTTPTVAVLAIPTFLSPNGDGRFDTAAVTLHVADNLYPTFTSTMTLTNAQGNTVTPFDAVALQTGTNTLTWDGRIAGALLPEGVYDYAITVADAGGNLAQAIAGTLTYDLTPPQIQVVGGTAQAFSPNADAVQDIVTVTYTLTDNLFTEALAVRLNVITLASEPILATEVITGGTSAEQTLTWNGSNAAINAAFDGTYYFEVVAEDPAGNRSVPTPGEAVTTGEILVDREAPTTTLIITGPTHHDGTITWLGTDATMALTATDPIVGAGVEAITYQLETTQKYTTPFGLPATDITYPFSFYATDFVGNTEPAHLLSVRADTAPPVSTLTIGIPQETGAPATTAPAQRFVAPITPFQWEAVDGAGVGIQVIWTEFSGAKAPSAYEAPITLAGLGDGAYTVRYWAEDWLGNAETPRTEAFLLDGTPPVTTLQIGTPHDIAADESGTYLSPDTVVSFSATTERDDLAATEYRVGDGPWLPAEPFALPVEGTYTITYRSSDRLGNVEHEQTHTLIVDNTPPMATLAFSQTGIGGSTDLTPLTQLTLTATATGSGVAGLEYQIDDGPWIPYTDAIRLAGHTPGSHVIRYRVRDRLGNESAAQSFEGQLIDLEVTRSRAQLPRVLVFLLQTHDLHATDPRPNSAFLNAVREELGGYWTIIDGDQNDPATVERFLAELRSDKYTTIIFATDALVVRFHDTTKVHNLLKELKARIYKGDTFFSLVGTSEITDPPWAEFRTGFTPREETAVQHFADVASSLHISDLAHGNGQIVEFGGDVGRLAETNATTGAVLRTGLAALIQDAIPQNDELNLHEVIDYTLTYRNKGDQAVTVDTTERWPPGWIETRATGGEVAIAERGFTLTIPPRGTTVVDYLYRAEASAGAYEVTTNTTATWEHGLQAIAAVSEPYVVSADVAQLFDRLVGPQGLLINAAMPTVRQHLHMARQRWLLAPAAGASAAEIDATVRMLLAAMEAVDAQASGTAAVRTGIAELIEVVGAQQAYGALTVNLAVSRGDPNDPASFHGDTASFLGEGEGGCTLVPPR